MWTGSTQSQHLKPDQATHTAQGTEWQGWNVFQLTRSESAVRPEHMGEKTSMLEELSIQLFMRDNTKQGSRILRKLPVINSPRKLKMFPIMAG